MNYHKKGLKRLLNEVLDGSVGRLVITHKDRLMRFGAELVFAICEAKNVEVVILNQGKDTAFEDCSDPFRPGSRAATPLGCCRLGRTRGPRNYL